MENVASEVNRKNGEQLNGESEPVLNGFSEENGQEEEEMEVQGSSQPAEKDEGEEGVGEEDAEKDSYQWQARLGARILPLIQTFGRGFLWEGLSLSLSWN